MSTTTTTTGVPRPRGAAAHRAPAEAIDVLQTEAAMLALVRQLLPHAKHCGCVRCVTGAVTALAGTAS